MFQDDGLNGKIRNLAVMLTVAYFSITDRINSKNRFREEKYTRGTQCHL